MPTPTAAQRSPSPPTMVEHRRELCSNVAGPKSDANRESVWAILPAYDRTVDKNSQRSNHSPEPHIFSPAHHDFESSACNSHTMNSLKLVALVAQSIVAQFLFPSSAYFEEHTITYPSPRATYQPHKHKCTARAELNTEPTPARNHPNAMLATHEGVRVCD